MKWTYGDYKIEIAESGRFFTTINGEKRYSSSLASTKALIDKEGGFKPIVGFPNWDSARGEYQMKAETVVRQEDGRFITSSGTRCYAFAEDTPANREALAELRAAYVTKNETEGRLQKAIDDAKAKVAVRRPAGSS